MNDMKLWQSDPPHESRHGSPIRFSHALLVFALLSWPLAGCREGAEPAELDPASLKLTQVAAEGSTELGSQAPEASEDAEDPAGSMSTPMLPTPDPMSELQLEGAGLPDVPTDPDLSGSQDPVADPAEAARATQMAVDAEIGVANVNDLVLAQAPIATFAPADAGEIESRSELLYVRNGALWKASARGGTPSRLSMEREMPNIWAPPEDPGRAWLAPDGEHVAFFVSSDAELWISRTDGRDNHAVSGPNLPPGTHAVSDGSAEQDVRIKPGTFYTLVRLAEGEGDSRFGVLIDNLEDERRGQARLRFVHAMEDYADEQLQVYIGGAPFGAPMRYGRSSGEISTPVGPIVGELRDLDGKTVAAIPAFEVASKEIKSVFLLGGDPVRSMPVTYAHQLPAGTASNVRIFNGGADAATVSLDGDQPLAGDLQPAQIAPYVRVQSVLSTDQRSEVQLAIYGNRTREYPIAWSRDGENIAFMGAVDGLLDLYVSTIDGPARRLTQDQRREINPAWSPDGKKLAWLAEEVTVVLFEVMYWSDGEVKTVDFGPLRQALGLPPTQKIFFPDELAWVDDHRFAISPRVDNVSYGIWLVDTRTGGLNQLYSDTVYSPRWSDAAEAWLFTPDEETGRIIKLELDGTATTLVEGDMFSPVWSPDGEKISYVQGQRLDGSGWIIHVMDEDGRNQRALTPKLPTVQFEPPVPGPDAKRIWLEDGEVLLFSRVGRDYGAAERAGIGRVTEAGPDLENWFAVRVDGSWDAPRPYSDLTQAFYLDDLAVAPDEGAIAFTGFWYHSRTKQLWAMPPEGGKPVQIDGPVRWYTWID